MRLRFALATIAAQLALTGCASMIEEIGPNRYRMALGEESTRADAQNAEDAAEEDAREFCAQQGRGLNQWNVDTLDVTVGRDNGPSTSIKKTLTFRCE